MTVVETRLSVWEALAGRRLTVVGDRDPFVPVGDARAFDPDAIVLPDCGHLPALERPAELGQLLDEAVAGWT